MPDQILSPAGASQGVRGLLKRALALLGGNRPAEGATLLIYHRVGGGTTNELDLDPVDFSRQLDLLANHDVLSLDAALDRLEAGDHTPSFVLTFDDGFADVYDNAWPLLRDRRIPFTIYLATAYMGGIMVWEGATATGEPGRGLSWDQLREMVASGLCTIGNHTHNHVRPEVLTVEELDFCTERITQELGLTPRHFTYPWGIPVHEMEAAMRARFRSASTGKLGRNTSGTNRMDLRRVPVRRTDPPAFFAAKLRGGLPSERTYAGVVCAVKALARWLGRWGPRRS
ncbi:MAG: polysaccharide deacetylase family protein [Lentisphaerae bacterium]|nr:polysaccharide deacetylase family protein [Lentisphaerota bacterium]